ncbi:hypothetical protein K8O68_13585 [Salipaludibacillus sp. CUR1]|uniref:hypothetical protein n=1 Tax=Salipaludibacillus sp. CUR1 TaxID=2820003 RepID=UPI001E610309|nr:hypothetical protein [Salipaludibacillus sp. CUR1]MCE7793452.1 hypothetical protein [Salipaludibacillus sp. CUR1]
MSKQTMTKEMQEKVNEIATAVAKLRDKIDELEELAEQDAETVTEIEQELEIMQAEKDKATDVTEAKKLVKKVQELEEQIELQQGVNKAVANQRTGELEEIVQELFKVHNSAKLMYTALESEYKETVSVRSLKEDNETLREFAKGINHPFKFARSVLLDFGIVDKKNQNQRYNGTHLGQRELTTDLERLFTLETRRGNY